ncbi:MAG: penicillin-binding protein 1C [Nibricoccus sp.]
MNDTTVLVDRSGAEIATIGSKRARVAEAATLAEMGPWIPRITVALEDHRFWSHSGVDFIGLFSAIRRDVWAFRLLSGGSTIAQQLIKNTRGRSGWRLFDKTYEMVAAVRLTREWSRERILEEYLNSIDYGNRRIGIKAAARAYFSKELRDLTLAEAIYLVSLPQAPTRFNPWKRPESAEKRYKRVIAQLQQRDVLDKRMEALLASAPPPVEHRSETNAAPHFVDALEKRVKNQRGRVETTLDLALQRKVQRLVKEHVEQLRGRGVGQAAAVVLDNRSGGVLAMVGSASYDSTDGQINGALLARSCGSVLKPFLYAEAIERRLLTAASVLPDTPDVIRATFVDYDPRNFDERYLGPVRLREALGNSLNVPAVYTLAKVGARPFFHRLGEWGFCFPRDLDDYGAGLILGNAEVRLLDLAAAFSGFAQGGKVATWRMLANDPSRVRAVSSPQTAAIIADILCDDDARRRAFGRGSPLATAKRYPCKTGTSSGFHDAWTVGATAEHTVAVWAGNFDGRPMESTSSIEAAAPLWREVIDLLEQDDGMTRPDELSGITHLEVCRLTGRLPTGASPGQVKEYFLPGTEPCESANVWLRTDDRGTSLVLPAEYAAWCASAYNHLGALVAEGEKLVIRCPADRGQYMLDRQLPAEQQQLSLEATGLPEKTIRWKIDGREVARSGNRWLWALELGEHEVVAVGGGLSARVRFVVER